MATLRNKHRRKKRRTRWQTQDIETFRLIHPFIFAHGGRVMGLRRYLKWKWNVRRWRRRLESKR